MVNTKVERGNMTKVIVLMKVGILKLFNIHVIILFFKDVPEKKIKNKRLKLLREENEVRLVSKSPASRALHIG